jgi:hypothetical protein
MTDSKLAETTKAVGKLFGTAAQLAQKQAALATLNNVTLPKLYHAIGKKIVSLEKLPPDLVPHREKIRSLEAGINSKSEELPAAPAEGFAAKAKHLAQQAAQKASKATADAAATMQIQAAYVGLGKEAVEKYGEKAIPKELHAELATAQASHESLLREISCLRESSRVGLLTPTRVLAGLAALGLTLTASMFWPATHQRVTVPSASSPGEAGTESRQVLWWGDDKGGASLPDRRDGGEGPARPIPSEASVSSRGRAASELADGIQLNWKRESRNQIEFFICANRLPEGARATLTVLSTTQEHLGFFVNGEELTVNHVGDTFSYRIPQSGRNYANRLEIGGSRLRSSDRPLSLPAAKAIGGRLVFSDGVDEVVFRVSVEETR